MDKDTALARGPRVAWGHAVQQDSNQRQCRSAKAVLTCNLLYLQNDPQPTGAHLVINVVTKSVNAFIMLMVFIVFGSIIFGSAIVSSKEPT